MGPTFERFFRQLHGVNRRRRHYRHRHRCGRRQHPSIADRVSNPSKNHSLPNLPRGAFTRI